MSQSAPELTTADLLLSYNLRPYPGLIEADGSPVPTGPKLNEMLAVLRDVAAAGHDIGPTVNMADIEDFWEDAIRIATVHRSATSRGLRTATVPRGHTWTHEELTRRLGPVSIYETGHHEADILSTHPAVRNAALTGRTTVTSTYLDPHSLGGDVVCTATQLAAMGRPPKNDTLTVLRWLAAHGHDHAVIKAAGSKAGITRIALCNDPVLLADRVFSGDFGYTMLRLEGLPNALHVSPWIPMTYEYRLFVVDGIVVTGAGCIEEFTPLDHEDPRDRFDPWVRRDRGNGIAATHDTAPQRSPALVQLYRDFAATVLAHLNPHEQTIEMDLAMIEDRADPVLIELNGMSNAGLYAINAQALSDALVTANNRGYWDVSFIDQAYPHTLRAAQ